MRLLEIGIRNYKSLRDVTFRPGPLSVLIGPNAAGKSNFCDALDFIEGIYEWGLQAAVMRHGGFENIRYLSMGESPLPVGFRLRAKIGRDAFGGLKTNKPEHGKIDGFLVDHEIEFAATSAGFRVTRESIQVYGSREALPGGRGEELARYGQEDGRITVMEEDRLRRLLPWAAHSAPAAETLVAAPETMSLTEFGVGVGLLLRRALSEIRVFHVAAAACRGPGIPTPNPLLAPDGGNLPAVIEFAKRHQKKQYELLLATLRTVMPTLDEIDVVDTAQRTKDLSFREHGFRDPWTTRDVSDGTIRSLALLTAILDPAFPLTVIEEPENSLHPWAIRQFVDACRAAAETKQIILTTHSPVLINCLRPSEIWIVQRPETETRVDCLAELDPDAERGWEEGKYDLADYLDSGVVPGAVPAPPPTE